jgi:predicted metal-dependent HD superfamily phosphohydrolase
VRERWASFWKSAGAAGDPEPAWRDLAACYGESHRAYHTLRHIGQCLGEFDAVRSLARDPAVVELALWYHDAVYDPRRRDNEERSSVLASGTAAAMGFPAARGAAVADLIRVSTHRKTAEDADARLFADIDLSILGQAPALFDEYERQVRVEYGWVPEADFRSGRAAILKSFVARPFLYGTPAFREKYEEAARRNLAESIRRLA